MALPDIIATVTIPERGQLGERLYERFRGVMISGSDMFDRYTLTEGGGHYDEHGAFVLEETGHIEHIHHHDKERGRTGRLLASIRMESRFGERRYVMEIYDRDFAELVNRRWGGVSFRPAQPSREQDEGVYAKR